MSKEIIHKTNEDRYTAASSENVINTSGNYSLKPENALPDLSKQNITPVQANKQMQPSLQKSLMREGNIPDYIRTKMEKSFGTDFSDVKVHQNSEEAKSLNAVAFTQGNEIHFASGYNPYSSQGQEYLGHELLHVLQQKSGIVEATHQEQGFNVNFNDTFEKQADLAGKTAAAGQHVNSENIPSGNSQRSFIQKKSAPIQLLRAIPAAGFILDVNTTADIVLQDLIHVASRATRQYSDVNWRQLFYPAIEAQIRGRQLGSISYAWTDTEGIDVDWEVNISFSLDNPQRTSRPTETRSITTSQGGSATPSLGSSQTVTTGQSAGAEGSVTDAPGGVGKGGKVSVGINDSTARGQSQTATGGLTGGQSQTSQERVSRYIANLYTTINVRASAGYSNWDIINPVKWGAHLAGTQSAQETLHIGTITYDQPNF
jgi:hypothetical protein